MQKKQQIRPGDQLVALVTALEQYEKNMKELEDTYKLRYQLVRNREDSDELMPMRKKLESMGETITDLKKQIKELCDKSPEANLTKLNLDFQAQMQHRIQVHKIFADDLEAGGKASDLSNRGRAMFYINIDQADKESAAFKEKITQYEKQFPKAKAGVPKTILKNTATAEKKTTKDVSLLKKKINEWDEIRYQEYITVKPDPRFPPPPFSDSFLRTQKQVKRPPPKKPPPVAQQMQQMQQTQPTQTAKQQPRWIDTQYQKPKLLASMEGHFKEKTFKDELQKLNSEGFIKKYGLADKGFKVTTTKDVTITFDTQNNKIYATDLSQETYDVAARVAIASGSTGFDMKELVAAAAKNPDENKYLYRAYAAGRKLEGFKFTNLPPDIESKLDADFLKEQQQFSAAPAK